MINFKAATEPLDIVLVEDDDGDAKAIRRALQKAGIANPVVRVIDGVEALSLLRGESGRAPPRYVLLVDLNMPRMNGIEFLAELRSDPRLKRAVVFVITTSDDVRDLMAAYGEQVAGYILKQRAGPNFDSLVATLDHYRRIVRLPDMRIADVRH
ncbi:response regulator [Oceanicola granulosus]|uniref:response regulator n=1 Tax=Oceanicola granulosus TaxID=252302 RepID=UPI00058B09EF|nr:response regulator [Oceanicola granulosus]